MRFSSPSVLTLVSLFFLLLFSRPSFAIEAVLEDKVYLLITSLSPGIPYAIHIDAGGNLPGGFVPRKLRYILGNGILRIRKRELKKNGGKSKTDQGPDGHFSRNQQSCRLGPSRAGPG